MKIGIVTFHRARNYGAVLQAYGFQEYLAKQGHNPFFVDYKFKFSDRGNVIKKWLGKSPKKTFLKFFDNLRYLAYDRFVSSSLALSDMGYSDSKDLIIHCPAADAFICGSDQVWNPHFIDNESDETVAWLRFCEKGSLKIAYAVSFGLNEAQAIDIPENWPALANDFKAISLREKNDQIEARLGLKDADLVADPVILAGVNVFNTLIDSGGLVKRGGIFCFKILEDKNLEVLAALKDGPERIVNGNGFEWQFKYGCKGPKAWLEQIKHSDFLVTDSYHACVFGVLFHVPFAVMLHRGAWQGRNCRILSLMAYLGLNNRVLASASPSIREWQVLRAQEIDWAEVDVKLACLRASSEEFLGKALK